MMSIPKNINIENQILAALSHAEYERLRHSMEPVQIPKGRVLFEAGDNIRHAYFLLSGLVSLLSISENGDTTEIAMVGAEGMVGIPLILKTNIVPYRVIVQIPTTAMRISSDALRRELRQEGALPNLLLHYTHSHIAQIAQSVICNSFHSTEERLCRWLLVARDSAQEETFQITHENLAHILGAPRTGVSVAAGTLQQAGLIRYSRGQITILNRPGLEARACECYMTIRDGIQHFLAA